MPEAGRKLWRGVSSVDFRCVGPKQVLDLKNRKLFDWSAHELNDLTVIAVLEGICA